MHIIHALFSFWVIFFAHFKIHMFGFFFMGNGAHFMFNKYLCILQIYFNMFYFIIFIVFFIYSCLNFHMVIPIHLSLSWFLYLSDLENLALSKLHKYSKFYTILMNLCLNFQFFKIYLEFILACGGKVVICLCVFCRRSRCPALFGKKFILFSLFPLFKYALIF